MTSITSQLEEIQEIHNLYSEIDNKRIRESLLYKLSSTLDEVIHDSDQLYYDTTILKNKNLIKNINGDKHVSVMKTMDTLYAFMPYMIMYNMLQSQSEDVE